MSRPILYACGLTSALVLCGVLVILSRSCRSDPSPLPLSALRVREAPVTAESSRPSSSQADQCGRRADAEGSSEDPGESQEQHPRRIKKDELLSDDAFSLPFGEDGKVITQRWLRDGLMNHLDHAQLNPNHVDLSDSEKLQISVFFETRLGELQSTVRVVNEATNRLLDRRWASGEGEKLQSLSSAGKSDFFGGHELKTAPFDLNELEPGQRLSVKTRDGETRAFTTGWGDDRALDQARSQLQQETEALVNDIRDEIHRIARRR